ncbi:MAG TPA: M23 family metallopeptidase [Jatrophihabitans sp.]|nr:M23 family metallopeptidase [Jatrophihabitans sp.]
MLARLVMMTVLALTSASPGSQHAPPGQPGVLADSQELSTPRRYLAPVPGPLVVRRGFTPPATRFGPGHLGVDLAVSPGTVVRAAASGVVRFAGVVAGRGVLVIAHPDGLSTEYEPVRAQVGSGAVVSAGQRIGIVAGTHGDCTPGRCLHWGARRGADYLDPLALLGGLGPVRLVPWDWLPGTPLS